MSADYVCKLTLPVAVNAAELIESAKPRLSLIRFAEMLKRIASGRVASAGSAVVFDAGTSGATAASGTVTFASVAAADTVTVGEQVFTASASPSGDNQFLVTGGDTAAAAALAAKINAHPSLTGAVTASSAAGVCTVTCAVPGTVGNGYRFTSSTGVRAATTGSGYLASGASTRTSFSF